MNLKSGTIEQIKTCLKVSPVTRAFLFGSFARGESNSNSDIDILVELEKNTDIFQFIAIKLNLEKILNKEVDLVSSKGVSPHLQPFIDRDKVLIYEK